MLVDWQLFIVFETLSVHLNSDLKLFHYKVMVGTSEDNTRDMYYQRAMS